MLHKLIKTENYLLVVDDSEIKEGDWIFANQGVHIVTDVKDDKYPYGTLNNKGDKIYHHKSWKKITSHLPLNNSPILEGVDLLPPLEDEVEKLARDNASMCEDDWEDGYNKAKEKYKYTEENILIIRNKLVSMLPKGDVSAWDVIVAASKYTIWFDNYIQHLQQPKIPVGFESEDEVYMYSINGDTMKPKTTTNSQGQTVLVGTYKYE